jgi:hypothetical protein
MNRNPLKMKEASAPESKEEKKPVEEKSSIDLNPEDLDKKIEEALTEDLTK